MEFAYAWCLHQGGQLFSFFHLDVSLAGLVLILVNMSDLFNVNKLVPRMKIWVIIQHNGLDRIRVQSAKRCMDKENQTNQCVCIST